MRLNRLFCNLLCTTVSIVLLLRTSLAVLVTTNATTTTAASTSASSVTKTITSARPLTTSVSSTKVIIIKNMSSTSMPPTPASPINDLCSPRQGLVRKQIEICKRNYDVMGSVKYGILNAVKECQYQFLERRWNCSTLNAYQVVPKIPNEGTREAAFIHALAAAGVAHSVTRACSMGKLMRCGCDRSIQGLADGFQWAGCSDNIAYGTAFSKSFLDARDSRSARSNKPSSNRARALMNLHNNNAGRKLVMNNMKIECKCHGVSGSCELKTCWRAMPSFREIGHILKDGFDAATEVQLQVPPTRKPRNQQRDKSKMIAASMTLAGAKKPSQKKSKAFLVPANPYFKQQTETDLIYLHSSPDFCEKDERIGSLGTHGRICNRTSKALDGCDLMCCGRGYATKIERKKERCDCKFHWCCYVECKECWVELEINTCL